VSVQRHSFSCGCVCQYCVWGGEFLLSWDVCSLVHSSFSAYVHLDCSKGNVLSDTQYTVGACIPPKTNVENMSYEYAATKDGGDKPKNDSFSCHQAAPCLYVCQLHRSPAQTDGTIRNLGHTEAPLACYPLHIYPHALPKLTAPR